MEFTYQSYKNLLNFIKGNQYFFTDYHHYKEIQGKICILRHDIDESIEKAYQLSELETKESITSTWFVLLTSNFYNPATKENRRMLRDMVKRGHEIGLHFDEVAWGRDEDLKKRAEQERARLEEILEVPITTMSMHRPSKKTLEENWQFEHMINSYSEEFFKNFKYLSDSRRRWREPVEEIIHSGEYCRLHILTHAFWYQEQEMNIHDTMKNYIMGANEERYLWECENTSDMKSILTLEEIRGENNLK